MTTRRLLEGRVQASPQYLVAGGIMLCCLLFYFITSGAMLLKEGGTAAGITAVGYVLAGLSRKGRERMPWRDWIALIFALALLALLRTTYIYFIAIGALLVLLDNGRHNWGGVVALLLLTGVAFVAGTQFAAYSIDNHKVIVDGGWDMQHFYLNTPSQRPFLQYIGNYFLFPWWKRALLLPITMGVQFMIPFPWIAYAPYTLPYIMSRISYGWYIVGGIALFYYLFIGWRRHGNLGAWAWWPAICFAAIAYTAAGSVTRYVLPFEVMFIPAAMFVLCLLREGYCRRPFKVWAVVYVVVVAVTLITCLQIQTGAVERALTSWGVL